nr:histidine kinase [Kineosporia babensis]
MLTTSTVVSAVYGTATALAPVLLGQLILARRDLAERLREIQQARAHEQILTTQSVLATERAQLAREMHDVVSHQVSLIAVRAGALQVSTHDPEVKEAASTIRGLSVRTLNELRHMVGVLRTSGSAATELTPQPTLDELPDLVANSAVDARLELNLPGELELTPPVQRALYRMVQEGLTNVRKHAPGSTAVVEISSAEGEVHASVTNSAPARPVLALPGAHHGLVGLRQRAELLRGRLEAEPLPDHGFRLAMSLPLTT